MDRNDATWQACASYSYPVDEPFVIYAYKQGANAESHYFVRNPSGCNVVFPGIASNSYVYFNGTGGFSANNFPAGYSVNAYKLVKSSLLIDSE